MLTTAEDAAVMGATFANNCTNPITGEDVLPQDVVNQTVTVMMSCGMYNGAGKWIVDVGIPAKSGVAGLLMCVVPGVCGVGIFSPKLDTNGNSTRGVLVATLMSSALGLHVLKAKDPSHAQSPKHSKVSKSKSTYSKSNSKGDHRSKGSRGDQLSTSSSGDAGGRRNRPSDRDRPSVSKVTPFSEG